MRHSLAILDKRLAIAPVPVNSCDQVQPTLNAVAPHTDCALRAGDILVTGYLSLFFTPRLHPLKSGVRIALIGGGEELTSTTTPH